MLLFLCYICPPFAVLLMGRPFSACLNFFLTMFGWAPGVRHALVCYADRRTNQGVKKVTKAINRPQYIKEQQRAESRRSSRKERVIVLFDSPDIGQSGHRFRPRDN